MHSIRNQIETTAVPSQDTWNTRESSLPRSGTIILHQNTGWGSGVSTAELAYATIGLFEGKDRASSALEAKGMAPEGSIRQESMAPRKRGGFANKELILSARQQQLHEQLSSQTTQSGSHTSRVRANAMGAADKSKKDALGELQQEIMQINLSSNPANIKGSFLRADSNGQRMIKNAIIGEFQAPAQKLMANVFGELQQSLSSLGPNASMNQIDHALADAYKTMINGFRVLDFPESLNEVSTAISSSLAKTTDTQATKAKSDMQRQIRTLSADLRSGIKKALLLRLFTPHVLEITRGAVEDSKETVDRLNGWLNAHPKAKLAGFNMAKFANMLTTNINGATGAKYQDLELHFPTLVQAMKETRLDL